jgi:colanic acid/amylovoran biosynthesis glycosyltransferase
MKVLYVLRYFPTLTETFVYREIDELQSRGIAVEAVAMGSRSDGALADSLPTIPVHRPPRGLHGLLMLLGVAWYWCRSSRARAAARWLRQYTTFKSTARALLVARKVELGNYNRVHVHFAGEAAEWGHAVSMATGVPFSVMVHAVDMFKPRLSFGDVVRAASPLVTISHANIKQLEQEVGVSAKLVRCGVEPTQYAQASQSTAGPMRIVAVGRNVPKKGFDLLVAAVRSLGDSVTLRLVSDYPNLSHEESIVVGALPPSEVGNALAAADIFVLPCRVAPDGDKDGIPVAMMEAMAVGLPVVTTRVSGIPELVDDAVGWLVPVDDEAALVDVLRSAAGDPDGRVRRGAAARKRILEEGFTVSDQVSALCAAWE